MYFFNQRGLFYSAHVREQIFSSTVILRFLPPASFTPSSSHKLHVTRGLSLAYAVTVVTCVALFSRILLFMILPLDNIMELKISVEVIMKQRQVVRLENKDSKQVARCYERSSSWPNIPFIFYCKVEISVDILL
jgi:hypothetical protein